MLAICRQTHSVHTPRRTWTWRQRRSGTDDHGAGYGPGFRLIDRCRRGPSLLSPRPHGGFRTLVCQRHPYRDRHHCYLRWATGDHGWAPGDSPFPDRKMLINSTFLCNHQPSPVAHTWPHRLGIPGLAGTSRSRARVWSKHLNRRDMPPLRIGRHGFVAHFRTIACRNINR